MKYLIGLTLFLVLGSVAEAGGCYSAYTYSYAPSYSYYPAGVYNGAFFSAGYWNGYYRLGYGIDYGIPVVQLAAVPLVAPAVAAYPQQQQMPQQMQQGQQRQLTPSQVDKVIQLLEYLEEQKTQTPPPAMGN